MRILRGLSSRFLPCGCLAGIYETYDGAVVAIVDARNGACADQDHRLGNRVSVNSAGAADRGAPASRPDDCT
jgi:hypothetical protein